MGRSDAVHDSLYIVRHKKIPRSYPRDADVIINNDALQQLLIVMI